MSEEPVKPLLPKGVAYKRLTVRINEVDTVVHIPLREAEHFKDRISETPKLTPNIFKSLMREFRGIRNNEEENE